MANQTKDSEVACPQAADDALSRHGHLSFILTPFVVGRDSSDARFEEHRGIERSSLATHDASVDEPRARGAASTKTGTISNIVQSVKMPDGNIKGAGWRGVQEAMRGRASSGRGQPAVACYGADGCNTARDEPTGLTADAKGALLS